MIANVLSPIKQIWLIFNHWKLWVAVARHNIKWVKIYIIEISGLKPKVIYITFVNKVQLLSSTE